MSTTAIADYALLSDCHTAALVSRAGSIDWLCFPPFDRPSTFARLLDQDGGHFSIQPLGVEETSRSYLGPTMVLETKFRTATGTLSLVDGLAVGRNERGHELGADSPHVLLRRVTCLEGKAEIAVEYAPRPEYGLIHPLLAQVEGGVAARGGAERLALSTPVEMNIRGSQAQVRISLEEGDTVAFALQHRASWEEPPGAWSQNEILGRLEDTVAAWRSWSALHQNYQGPWEELIHTSGRVLQALTFQPTGAISAQQLRPRGGPAAVPRRRPWPSSPGEQFGPSPRSTSSPGRAELFPDMVGSKDCLELGDQAPKGFRRPRGASQLMDQDLKRVYGVELYALLSQECPDLDFGSLSLRLASRTSVG